MTNHDLTNRLVSIYWNLCRARKKAIDQGAEYRFVEIREMLDDAIVDMDILSRELAIDLDSEVANATSRKECRS